MRLWKVFLLLLVTTLAVSQTAPLKAVEVSDMDRSADPCTDFYQYANGTWRAQNPIPASMTRWSRRWAAGETTKDKLKAILDEAARAKPAPKGSTEQLIGDFYGACTDDSRVNARGIEPLRPYFERIDAAKDMAALQQAMMQLHDNLVVVPFALSGSQDPHEPTMVMADISANALGLPERDYYLRPEPRFADARDKYRQHIINMFKLVGWDDPKSNAAAQTVITMETSFAKATLSPAELRDPKATDHKTTFGQLQQMAPHVDWPDYFKHKQLPQDVDLNVQEPRFVEEVERQMQVTSLDDWKIYFKWHLLSQAASYLSDPLVNEDFAFNGKYLGGATEIKPRWKRCVEDTDFLLGEALGQKYVEKYFPPEAKARMQDMVKNLLAAMKDDIVSLPWMSAGTKQKALAKLSTFNPKIGYPDKWKDYSSVDVHRDLYFENAMNGRKFLVEDDRSTIGRPVDRGRWGMTPPTSDAYYNPLLNEIVFPAGILQPPAFNMEAVDAVNYGAIGVVIGHEISHGFDDQGAQYDAKGALNNWWTADDLKKFQARAQCVADQFDNYFIEPGVHHNGKLVLGESIGDLGGLKIAYLAYQKSLEGKPRPADIDGFTPEQQFFIAWGQFRGDATRIEQQRLMMQTDPHPVAKYRVIGPLSNFTEFQKAFQCKADSAMVRPADKRCEVW
ncbi:MAG TPA: M13 family metallopeptidase [Terriglobales bacterium]|nr:M13 family metallopeptidase [Terriglobales bacterium]